jgi:hypothetical protein
MRRHIKDLRRFAPQAENIALSGGHLGVAGNPYLIALRQSRGGRAALAYAFVAVALKPVGTIEQMKMAAVSRLTDLVSIGTRCSRRFRRSRTRAVQRG